MQNGLPVDMSAQVERVKRRTRPWKPIIALVFAIGAAVISHQARQDSPPIFSVTNHFADRFIWAGMAVAFLILGSVTTYSLAGKVRELLQPRAGTAHAAVAGYIILIVGAFVTLVTTLELFAVPIGQLVLGGALTSVFVGIAAQQALGNVFAGLVLLFARPFQVGDAIRLRAGALGGTLDGIVTDIGITYVRFDTDGSVMSIPNSQVLNAIVGPIPPSQEDPAPVSVTPVAPVAPEAPVVPEAPVASEAPVVPQAQVVPEAPAAPASADPDAAVVPDGKSGTPGGPEHSQPRPSGPT